MVFKYFVELRVFILGSGGFAKELRYYIKSQYQSNLRTLPPEVFLVDDSDGEALTLAQYWHQASSISCFSIMGSGQPLIKKQMLEQILPPFFSFRHPKASILSEYVGKGVVIAPSAVIAPYSKIGQHVLINYAATVGHNTVVDDLVVVGPNASIGGNVRIGKGAYIGAGAHIKENVIIGAWAVVGMGAVVLNDVAPGVTVVGVPARVLEKEL